jgi:hypothetical protein
VVRTTPVGLENRLGVASPQTVATALAGTITLFGRVPRESDLAAIELCGREVTPSVRQLLADTPDQMSKP